MNMKFNIYCALVGSFNLLACGQADSANDSMVGAMTSVSNSSNSSASSQTPSSQSSASSSSAPTSATRPDETSSDEAWAVSSAADESSGTRPPSPTSSETTAAEDQASNSEAPSSSDVHTASSETSEAPSSEGPIGEDPLGAAATCSSGMYWQRGENERMRPGEACITCHTAENEGPRYAIAGTLFPTGHEPDDCNGISGAASGAKVVITDANGTDHELAPNDVGNFFFNGSIPKPYTAKVVSDAGERLMVTPQQDGDCNKCHTAAGAGGAPGRVVVPF